MACEQYKDCTEHFGVIMGSDPCPYCRIEQLEHDLGEALCMLRGDQSHRKETLEFLDRQYPDYQILAGPIMGPK